MTGRTLVQVLGDGGLSLGSAAEQLSDFGQAAVPCWTRESLQLPPL